MGKSLSPSHWYLHMELLWSYIEKVSTVYYGCTYDREKVSTGMVDEKVTVISIFPEIAHFFGMVLKLGTH